MNSEGQEKKEESGVTQRDLQRLISEEIKKCLDENREKILARAMERLKEIAK